MDGVLQVLLDMVRLGNCTKKSLIDVHLSVGRISTGASLVEGTAMCYLQNLEVVS